MFKTAQLLFIVLQDIFQLSLELIIILRQLCVLVLQSSAMLIIHTYFLLQGAYHSFSFDHAVRCGPVLLFQCFQFDLVLPDCFIGFLGGLTHLLVTLYEILLQRFDLCTQGVSAQFTLLELFAKSTNLFLIVFRHRGDLLLQLDLQNHFGL